MEMSNPPLMKIDISLKNIYVKNLVILLLADKGGWVGKNGQNLADVRIGQPLTE